MKPKTIDKIEVNPFIRLDSIQCQLISYSSKGSGTASTWEFIDKTPRISVYPREFLDRYDTIKNSNCRDLLIYIMERLAVDSDKIQLEVDKLSDLLKIHRSTVYLTIDRLIEAEFICRATRKNMYWINPYLLFKGNRVAHYPEAITWEDKTDEGMAKRVKRDLIERKFPNMKAERKSAYSDEEETSEDYFNRMNPKEATTEL